MKPDLESIREIGKVSQNAVNPWKQKFAGIFLGILVIAANVILLSVAAYGFWTVFVHETVQSTLSVIFIATFFSLVFMLSTLSIEIGR